MESDIDTEVRMAAADLEAAEERYVRAATRQTWAKLLDIIEEHPSIEGFEISCEYAYDDEGSYYWSCGGHVLPEGLDLGGEERAWIDRSGVKHTYTHSYYDDISNDLNEFLGEKVVSALIGEEINDSTHTITRERIYEEAT